MKEIKLKGYQISSIVQINSYLTGRAYPNIVALRYSDMPVFLRPCKIHFDRHGVREVLDLQISESEKELLHRSAAKLKEIIESLGI